MANPIEDDPKLAQAVGILAGRFGLVEVMVEMIFVTVSGCDERRATILFSFFKGVSTQCDVIKLLAKTQADIDPPLFKRLTETLKRYTELATLRNGVIHYPFGWDTGLETPTIYKMRRTRSGPKVWVKDHTNHETVSEIAEQIEALFHEVLKLHMDISNTLREASLRRLQQLSPDQIREPSTLSRLMNLFPNEEPEPPPQSSEA